MKQFFLFQKLSLFDFLNILSFFDIYDLSNFSSICLGQSEALKEKIASNSQKTSPNVINSSSTTSNSSMMTNEKLECVFWYRMSHLCAYYSFPSIVSIISSFNPKLKSSNIDSLFKKMFTSPSTVRIGSRIQHPANVYLEHFFEKPSPSEEMSKNNLTTASVAATGEGQNETLLKKIAELEQEKKISKEMRESEEITQTKQISGVVKQEIDFLRYIKFAIGHFLKFKMKASAEFMGKQGYEGIWLFMKLKLFFHEFTFFFRTFLGLETKKRQEKASKSESNNHSTPLKTFNSPNSKISNSTPNLKENFRSLDANITALSRKDRKKKFLELFFEISHEETKNPDPIEIEKLFLRIFSSISTCMEEISFIIFRDKSRRFKSLRNEDRNLSFFEYFLREMNNSLNFSVKDEANQNSQKKQFIKPLIPDPNFVLEKNWKKKHLLKNDEQNKEIMRRKSHKYILISDLFAKTFKTFWERILCITFSFLDAITFTETEIKSFCSPNFVKTTKPASLHLGFLSSSILEIATTSLNLASKKYKKFHMRPRSLEIFIFNQETIVPNSENSCWRSEKGKKSLKTIFYNFALSQIEFPTRKHTITIILIPQNQQPSNNDEIMDLQVVISSLFEVLLQINKEHKQKNHNPCFQNLSICIKAPKFNFQTSGSQYDLKIPIIEQNPVFAFNLNLPELSSPVPKENSSFPTKTDFENLKLPEISSTPPTAESNDEFTTPNNVLVNVQLPDIDETTPQQIVLPNPENFDSAQLTTTPESEIAANLRELSEQQTQEISNFELPYLESTNFELPRIESNRIPTNFEEFNDEDENKIQIQIENANSSTISLVLPSLDAYDEQNEKKEKEEKVSRGIQIVNELINKLKGKGKEKAKIEEEVEELKVPSLEIHTRTKKKATNQQISNILQLENFKFEFFEFHFSAINQFQQKIPIKTDKKLTILEKWFNSFKNVKKLLLYSMEKSLFCGNEQKSKEFNFSTSLSTVPSVMQIPFAPQKWIFSFLDTTNQSNPQIPGKRKQNTPIFIENLHVLCEELENIVSMEKPRVFAPHLHIHFESSDLFVSKTRNFAYFEERIKDNQQNFDPSVSDDEDFRNLNQNSNFLKVSFDISKTSWSRMIFSINELIAAKCFESRIDYHQFLDGKFKDVRSFLDFLHQEIFPQFFSVFNLEAKINSPFVSILPSTRNSCESFEMFWTPFQSIADNFDSNMRKFSDIGYLFRILRNLSNISEDFSKISEIFEEKGLKFFFSSFKNWLLAQDQLEELVFNEDSAFCSGIPPEQNPGNSSRHQNFKNSKNGHRSSRDILVDSKFEFYDKKLHEKSNKTHQNIQISSISRTNWFFSGEFLDQTLSFLEWLSFSEIEFENMENKKNQIQSPSKNSEETNKLQNFFKQRIKSSTLTPTTTNFVPNFPQITTNSFSFSPKSSSTNAITASNTTKLKKLKFEFQNVVTWRYFFDLLEKKKSSFYFDFQKLIVEKKGKFVENAKDSSNLKHFTEMKFLEDFIDLKNDDAIDSIFSEIHTSQELNLRKKLKKEQNQQNLTFFKRLGLKYLDNLEFLRQFETNYVFQGNLFVGKSLFSENVRKKMINSSFSSNSHGKLFEIEIVFHFKPFESLKWFERVAKGLVIWQTDEKEMLLRKQNQQRHQQEMEISELSASFNEKQGQQSTADKNIQKKTVSFQISPAKPQNKQKSTSIFAGFESRSLFSSFLTSRDESSISETNPFEDEANFGSNSKKPSSFLLSYGKNSPANSSLEKENYVIVEKNPEIPKIQERHDKDFIIIDKRSDNFEENEPEDLLGSDPEDLNSEDNDTTLQEKEKNALKDKISVFKSQILQIIAPICGVDSKNMSDVVKILENHSFSERIELFKDSFFSPTPPNPISANSQNIMHDSSTYPETPSVENENIN